MGILTNIEESLSSKVGAALLVGASFSPFLRTAVASEGVNAESQAAIPISVSEIDKNPEFRQLIRPYGIVQNDSELAQVWTDQQSVYVDKAVIEKGVNPATFNNLAERINKDFPNWSVYITTPGKLFKEDPSKWQEMMKERLNNIVEDQFKDLTRFNINRDERSGVKNQSIILLCYGQGDLPTVLSWASPGESYVKYGLDRNYWIKNIAPEIGRDIARSGDVEVAVSNAITNFEDALTHRIFAAEEEHSAKVLQLREHVEQEKSEILTGLEKLGEELSLKVPLYDPATIQTIKAELQDEFDKIEQALKLGKLEEVEPQIKIINDIYATVVSNANGLASSLEIVNSATRVIEEFKSRWFLDEPGHTAIKNTEEIVSQIQREVLRLKLSSDETQDKIDQHIGNLLKSVSADQSAEVLTIVTGVMLGVPTTAILMCGFLTEMPNLISRMKQKIIEKKDQKRITKEKQDRIVSDLRNIGESLKEKRKSLNDLYVNKNIGTKIELESDSQSQSPVINYRQLLLQADQVLSKLEKIHKAAEVLASKKGGYKFEDASKLVNDRKVIIVELDELNFLKVVKDWKQATLMGDPHQFSPPCISFKELSKIFADLTERAFKALEQI